MNSELMLSEQYQKDVLDFEAELWYLFCPQNSKGSAGTC